MKLEINDKLQQDILSIMPNNYTNLEKALFIYNQLCLKLTYSLPNYIDENNNKAYFLNPENLKNVDGEKNTDVVCYTFNYIFLQMLINANIIKESNWEKNYPYDENNPNILKHAHRRLCFSIDGIDYKVDSTFGVLDNNDLTLAKYTTHTFNGWSTSEHRYDEKLDKTNIEDLNYAIEKVRSDCLKLEENATRYYEIKNNDSNFYKISLLERVEMFNNAIKEIPDYSLLSFNYLLKLKHKFFTNLEINFDETANKIDLLFVKNQKLQEYQAILFVGPNNNFSEKDYKNVQTYLISVKNKEVSKLEVEELKHLILNKVLTSRHDEEIKKYCVPLIKLEEDKQV